MRKARRGAHLQNTHTHSHHHTRLLLLVHGKCPNNLPGQQRQHNIHGPGVYYPQVSIPFKSPPYVPNHHSTPQANKKLTHLQ